jgi:methionyl-tRNA formyltransferase
MFSLKILMMGTGDFAAPAFESLYESAHRVVGLVTQPERAGPGKHHTESNRLKRFALAHGTPVFQPENVNTPESLAELRAFDADLFLVAAYGQILSPELLSIPKRLAINIHASLLPKYRGAAPVAYAILNGETETGVTIIEVRPQLDAGPILGVTRVPIASDDTAGTLEDRLALAAVPLVGRVLDEIAAGTAQGIPQDPALATRAPKLRKPLGAIDWTRPAREIDWQIRALQPWPNAFTFLHGRGKRPLRVVVLSAAVDTERNSNSPPGTILDADKSGIVVQTGAGVVSIAKLQPDGKRAMTAAEFQCGHPLHPGDRIGAETA